MSRLVPGIIVVALWIWCYSPVGAQAPLSLVVEAAKKEGGVSVTLSSDLAGKGVERLRKDVREKYGVDLQIAYQPVGAYPQRLATAITEHKAGVRPSFDLMVFSDTTLAQAIDAGIVEQVDWKPYLATGTPPQVIQFEGHAISTHTGHIGLIYNPRGIPAHEAPKSLSDLAQPRWKGKLIMYTYTSNYLGYAIVRGEEKMLSDLRAIMRNNPVVDTYARGFTRYAAGEYPVALTASAFYEDARKKGIPLEWVSPDMSYFSIHAVVVRKGARSPNAARLVAVFLASPEGHKFMMEEAGSGSVFYPGNVEHEIRRRDQQAGLPMYNPQGWPGALRFILSEKGRALDRRIGEILQGG